MVWLISIILVIILYLGIKYLYNEYKDVMNDVSSGEIKRVNKLNKRIDELERKVMINEKLIDWLYNELAKKNIIKELEKDDKNGRE